MHPVIVLLMDGMTAGKKGCLFAGGPMEPPSRTPGDPTLIEYRCQTLWPDFQFKMSSPKLQSAPLNTGELRNKSWVMFGRPGSFNNYHCSEGIKTLKASSYHRDGEKKKFHLLHKQFPEFQLFYQETGFDTSLLRLQDVKQCLWWFKLVNVDFTSSQVWLLTSFNKTEDISWLPAGNVTEYIYIYCS